MMPPYNMMGGYSSLPRYSSYAGPMQNDASSTSLASGGLMGDPTSIMPARPQSLPYALVPTTYTSPFGKVSMNYSIKAFIFTND